MLPNAHEFSWDPYRVVFVAFFLSAAAVIVGYLLRASWQSWTDLRHGRAAEVRWHDDFAELPPERRRCRHTLAGDAHPRLCENAFDCARCEHHRVNAVAPLADAVRVHGLVVHPDRGYHRGHTWVRTDADGKVSVGLSPLARRILPADLPLRAAEAGAVLRRGDAAFTLPAATLRILTPIEGRVLEVKEEDGTPVLHLQVDRAPTESPELLRGAEAVTWMEAELRQLQARLLGRDAAAAWADGGAVVDDLPLSVPDADWRSVREEFFLDV